MGDKLLADLHCVNHDPVAELDVGLLDRLLGSGTISALG
jgi:hypothetical protein